MEELEQFFILINNTVDSDLSPASNSFINVSLRDGGGKIVEKISENALLSDKNFRDLSGLSIGLTQAKNLGARRISIGTNNILLEILIKDEPGRTWKDNYGFHTDIKKMINGFEQVEVKIIGQESTRIKAA